MKIIMKTIPHMINCTQLHMLRISNKLKSLYNHDSFIRQLNRAYRVFVSNFIMSKLQLNPSFHSQMAADENFSRAMTNVITEDMEVLMADEVGQNIFFLT